MIPIKTWKWSDITLADLRFWEVLADTERPTLTAEVDGDKSEVRIYE